MSIMRYLKNLIATSFSVTETELSMISLLTHKTTFPEVNIAIKLNKIKQTVLTSYLFFIPAFIRVLVFILFLFFGEREKDGIFRVG